MNLELVMTIVHFLGGALAFTIGVYILAKRQHVFDQIRRSMRERVGKAGMFVIQFGKPRDLIYPGIGGIGIGVFLVISAVARMVGV
ncbi:hypothetical protein [Leifsonia sp. YAF41]|uniref:hypothetical protein n=1 Tax=Leifsonia sp. YAF41 TaxID=3233086 RepID=UPI003F981D5F